MAEREEPKWSYPGGLGKTGYRTVIEVRRLDGEPQFEAVAYLEPLPDADKQFERIRVADAHSNFENQAHAGAAAAIQLQLDKLAHAEMLYGHLDEEDEE